MHDSLPLFLTNRMIFFNIKLLVARVGRILTNILLDIYWFGVLSQDFCHAFTWYCSYHWLVLYPLFRIFVSFLLPVMYHGLYTGS
jgi:hypothetical protein